MSPRSDSVTDHPSMDNKYHLGYVPDTYAVKNPKFKIKSSHASKEDAQGAMKALAARSPGGFLQADYKILTTAEVLAHNTRAKEASAAARSATLLKNRHDGKARKPPVTCPSCKASSRKLFSELGGLQTRVCKNGHRFHWDTFGGVGQYRPSIDRQFPA